MRKGLSRVQSYLWLDGETTLMTVDADYYWPHPGTEIRDGHEFAVFNQLFDQFPPPNFEQLECGCVKQIRQFNNYLRFHRTRRCECRGAGRDWE